MICLSGFFINFLVIGPLFTAILVTSYLRGYVLFFIGLIIVGNFLFFRCCYLEGTHLERLDVIYRRGRNHRYFFQDRERGKQDFLSICITSAATSWVSPSVPWTHTTDTKTHYRLGSTIISLYFHLLAISCIYLTTTHEDILLVKNPPLIHCFPQNHSFNASEYQEFELFNSTFCNDNTCLAKIRICSESEEPNDKLFFFFCPAAIFLLGVSLLASWCLQRLGNYQTMYSWSKAQVWCNCRPIIHYSLLHNILWDANEIDGLTENQKNLFSEAIGNNETILNKREPLHGDTCLHVAFHAQQFQFLKHLISEGGNVDIPNRYNISVRDLISKWNSNKEGPELTFELPDISTRTRKAKEQKMHLAAKDSAFGWMCLYSLFGGQWGTQDEDGELFQHILNKITREKLTQANRFVVWMLQHASEPLYGYTLVHFATVNGLTDTLEILLDHNFSLKDRTKNNGREPLHLAMLMGENTLGRNATFSEDGK